MATPVIMPRQGQSVESCIIAKWHKQKGDKVEVGDMLFTYETDKATFDEEAKVAGTLIDVFFEEGDDVECLLNVCVIGNEGEDTAQFRPDGAQAPAEAAAPVAAAAPAAPAAAPAKAPLAPPEGNATPVIMPRQGQSVESCIIAKWHKQKGDKVEVGDLLFTYETDKATFDEEAKVAGTLIDVFFEEGDDVECLLNVCVIGDEGVDTAYFRPSGAEEEAPAQAPAVAAPAVAAAPAAVAAAPKENVFISPRAKNHAEKLGVDYRYAEGTGPKGRIIERDIEALAQSGVMFTKAAADGALAADGAIAGTGIGGRVSVADLNAPAPAAAPAAAVAAAPAAEEAEYVDVPMTNIRKVISKAMHNSLSSTAQLTLNTSFDATEIMAYRKKLKANAEKLGLGNITLNDIVLYAVSRTILQHKELNATLTDNTMRIFNHCNLGVAVDTPRGLMVPTIFASDLKSLSEISAETKELAKACQGGTISPDLLSGGSFTVTNLGSFGIESFTPVLNAPQTGILGVDTIVQRAKEVDGEIKFYPAMGLSLTFDHRAVDGAPAAKFLQDLKANLENFSVLLAK